MATTGIVKLHSKGCAAKSGGRCRCKAGYEASVYSKRDGKKIRKTFAREAEAKYWRAEALGALRRGGLRAAKPTTVEEAWQAWYEGAKAGTVTNRSGDPYKPSALRSYERAMRLRVLPEFGDIRLADLSRPDLQEFADGLLADGLSPSAVKVTLLPLRASCAARWPVASWRSTPATGSSWPRCAGGVNGSHRPSEAEALVAAVPLPIGHLGDGDVRRAEARRASGPPGRGRRPGERRDPRRARLG